MYSLLDIYKAKANWSSEPRLYSYFNKYKLSIGVMYFTYRQKDRHHKQPDKEIYTQEKYEMYVMYSLMYRRQHFIYNFCKRFMKNLFCAVCKALLFRRTPNGENQVF